MEATGGRERSTKKQKKNRPHTTLERAGGPLSWTRGGGRAKGLWQTANRKNERASERKREREREFAFRGFFRDTVMETATNSTRGRGEMGEKGVVVGTGRPCDRGKGTLGVRRWADRARKVGAGGRAGGRESCAQKMARAVRAKKRQQQRRGGRNGGV